MKYRITVETDDDFERCAIIDAVRNKLLIDQVYDVVFRPVIKYGEDKKEIKAYEMV
jgi:hypothetical protein